MKNEILTSIERFFNRRRHPDTEDLDAFVKAVILFGRSHRDIEDSKAIFTGEDWDKGLRQIQGEETNYIRGIYNERTLREKEVRDREQVELPKVFNQFSSSQINNEVDKLL